MLARAAGPTVAVAVGAVVGVFVEAQMKALGAVILETAWRMRMKGQAPPPWLPRAYVSRKLALHKTPPKPTP